MTEQMERAIGEMEKAVDEISRLPRAERDARAREIREAIAGLGVPDGMALADTPEASFQEGLQARTRTLGLHPGGIASDDMDAPLETVTAGLGSGTEDPQRRTVDLTRPEDGQWIQSTPGYAGGRPRIAGTRIKVQFIAIWHERMGLSPDEIATEYDLPLSAIYAALAYYLDHRADIDAQIDEDEAYVESMRRQTPSLVEAKLRGKDHPLLHR